MRMLSAIFALAFCTSAHAQPAAPAESRFIVSLPDSLAGDGSGRLLVFAAPLTEQNRDGPTIDANDYFPAAIAVAARDVTTFGDANAVTLDSDAEASPTAFSGLPPGEYRVQAVLDRNRDYARYWRGAGDLVSAVTTVSLPLAAPVMLDLADTIPTADPWAPEGADEAALAQFAALRPRLTDVVVRSPALEDFSGTAQTVRAWVLTPEGYEDEPDRRYPAIYMSGAYSSTRDRDIPLAAAIAARADMPAMIWVFLDFSSPTGATEFADSVNNGPWERALTQELLPEIERRFRTIAAPQGRFLLGHSSGGWSALWLQLRHPDLFGGAWATAPDPSDFSDFLGVDLYAPGANLYRDAAGAPRPFIRAFGQEAGTLRDYVRLMDVLGPVGGPMQSFDYVFSPRGADGRPLPMFDHVTGDVDPAVVDYWRRNFDIGRYVEANAARLRTSVAGRVRVIVGEQDTFRLEGSAHALEQAFARAGVEASFTFLPDRNHNNLYVTEDDPFGLMVAIASDMARIAAEEMSGAH